MNNTFRTIVCVVLVFFLYGCGTKALNCSDTETIDNIEKIYFNGLNNFIESQSKQNFLIKKYISNISFSDLFKLKFVSIVQTENQDKTKFECNGKLYIVNKTFPSDRLVEFSKINSGVLWNTRELMTFAHKIEAAMASSKTDISPSGKSVEEVTFEMTSLKNTDEVEQMLYAINDLAIKSNVTDRFNNGEFDSNVKFTSEIGIVDGKKQHIFVANFEDQPSFYLIGAKLFDAWRGGIKANSPNASNMDKTAAIQPVSAPVSAPVQMPNEKHTLVVENSREQVIQNNQPSGLSTLGGFTVIAPNESKEILTTMIKDAMNPLKLAESKGVIDVLPKPLVGDRKKARSLNERGLQSLKLNNFEEAINILKKSVDADPSDIEIRNNYVYSLIKARKYVEAETEAGYLLTYSPGRSSAWANLAEIYADNGKITEATAALIVTFQFSSNKDKTLTYLKEKSNSSENSGMQKSAKLALLRLSSLQ